MPNILNYCSFETAMIIGLVLYISSLLWLVYSAPVITIDSLEDSLEESQERTCNIHPQEFDANVKLKKEKALQSFLLFLIAFMKRLRIKRYGLVKD